MTAGKYRTWKRRTQRVFWITHTRSHKIHKIQSWPNTTRESGEAGEEGAQMRPLKGNWRDKTSDIITPKPYTSYKYPIRLTRTSAPYRFLVPNTSGQSLRWAPLTNDSRIPYRNGYTFLRRRKSFCLTYDNTEEEHGTGMTLLRILLFCDVKVWAGVPCTLWTNQVVTLYSCQNHTHNSCCWHPQGNYGKQYRNEWHPCFQRSQCTNYGSGD